MAEFLRIYTLLDCILLAEIFSNFIDFGLKNYYLNPEHFHTLPSYVLECCYLYLLKKNVYLQNIPSLEIYDYLREGVRGGQSTVGKSRLEFSKHFSRIPNEYFEKLKLNLKKLSGEENEVIDQTIDYLKKIKSLSEDSDLVYLDANSLYGSVMTCFLPLSDLEFLKKDQLILIERFFLNFEKKLKNEKYEEKYLNLDYLFNKTDVGFICTLDISYPKELHLLHSDFPLLPERHKISPDMLSPTQKKYMKIFMRGRN